MKRVLKTLGIGALMCTLGGFGSGCDKVDPFDPLVPDDPREVRDIKLKAGISDDEFCRHVDIENIHKTIPMVNRYINNLPGSLDTRQRAQALVALFQSFVKITGSRLFQDEYTREPAVLFSFMDGRTERELALDFSSTGKVLSYHYDVVTGAYVKIPTSYTIKQAFDFINSLDFEVKEIYGDSFDSRLPSTEERLQQIFGFLGAKPYIGNGVNGYCDKPSNHLHIYPCLSKIHNKEYQADWIKTISELTGEFVHETSGYVIKFLIREDATIPEKHWEDAFAKYDFLEWVEWSYNRHTLSDNTLGDEYEDNTTVIDSKIHIRPVEIYSASPRTFQFQCATERQYGSGSNPIIFVKQQSGNTIDISFKGVAETGMTNDIGPARAYIDLGAFDEGTYTLNLYNGNVKQTARIVVTAGSYTFEMTDNEIFDFTCNTLNRIPEKTIWGLVGYHKEDTAPLVNSFLEDLIALGAVEKRFEPGDYHSFWINENGNIDPYPDVLHGYWFARHFIFSYSDDSAKIDQLVKQYARDHKDEMDIQVFTDKGEKFLSWMYNK